MTYHINFNDEAFGKIVYHRNDITNDVMFTSSDVEISKLLKKLLTYKFSTNPTIYNSVNFSINSPDVWSANLEMMVTKNEIEFGFDLTEEEYFYYTLKYEVSDY